MRIQEGHLEGRKELEGYWSLAFSSLQSAAQERDKASKSRLFP